MLRLSLNDLAQTTWVENDLGDELVHDPALVELLWGVVLFYVERVHDWEDTEELGAWGHVNSTLRYFDRTLNLETTELNNALTGNNAVLEGPTGLVDVPLVQVAVVDWVEQ